ncbi:MAG: cytochrome b562 [Opitutales bacterium]|nr:cytochrome b562 [Opitutales bacterium]
MKKRSLIVTLALAIASLPSIQAASHEGGDHDHTALEDQMSAMNKAWRSIRRQIKDPAKNDSTLEFVAKVKKAAQKSVDMTPILAKEMSGAEKKKFMAGYQKAMKNTVGLIGDLEAALKAGDNVKAEEIVGKINDARKHGDDKYKPEDV